MADWAEKAVREILGRSDYAVTNIAPINDADLIQSLATALREARVAALEEGKIEGMTILRAAVIAGSAAWTGSRADAAAQIVHAIDGYLNPLKTTPAEEPTK
jgi:hypothetical protein